mgnify:CR=1 FL=1
MSSTNVMEVWKDHKMKLLCAVNVAEGVTPVFEWRRQSDGSVVKDRAKQHNTAISSTLQLFPHFEREFVNYVCVARTARTTKNHTVTIRRLCKYFVNFLLTATWSVIDDKIRFWHYDVGILCFEFILELGW